MGAKSSGGASEASDIRRGSAVTREPSAVDPEDIPQVVPLLYARVRGDDRSEMYHCRTVVVPEGWSVDEAVVAKAKELLSLDWRAA